MIVVSVLIVAIFKSMQMQPSGSEGSTDETDLYLTAMDFNDETSMVKPEAKV